MSIIPLGIILILCASLLPGFLDVLYDTTAGICIMTFCLALYLFAVFLGSEVDGY